MEFYVSFVYTYRATYHIFQSINNFQKIVGDITLLLWYDIYNTILYFCSAAIINNKLK